MPLAANSITAAHYKCVGCKESRLCFVIRVAPSGDKIAKVGQYAPWSISPPINVAKALGEHLPVYKKGLACESQGYGVGAFAYYRRVVEDIIGTLLNDIGALLKNDPAYETYQTNLANVQASKSAEARIAVVKDLLPPTLRPRGINPLGDLHEALSQGLHADSDEECLMIAEATRASLIYLIAQVEAAKQSATDYLGNMETIRKRLTQKGKTKIDPK